MSTGHRIAKNTLFLYVRLGVSMLISLVTTRLVLNSLGAEDFGIYNLVSGAIAMLGFLNACLAGATQRFISFAEGEGNIGKISTIFNISIRIHGLMAIIVGVLLAVFGYFAFASFLNIPDGRLFASYVVYGSMMLSTMFNITTAPFEAVINAHENMKYYALVGILESVLRLAVAIMVFFAVGDRLIFYGILMAVIHFVILIIMRRYCMRHYPECNSRDRQCHDKALVRSMLSYSGWSLMDAAAGIVGQYGLGMVLNHFYGTLLNAAQGIASQIGGQLSSFSRSLVKAVNPVITKSEGAGTHQSTIHYAIVGSKYTYMLLAFFAIPFMMETPYVLKIWLKLVPEWTVLFCRLQLVNALMCQFFVNLWATIAATGNIKAFYISKSIVNIMPLVLTWMCFSMALPPYCMYLVSIACEGIINGCIILYFSHRTFGLRMETLFKESILPVLLITTVSILGGVLPLSILEESFGRLLLTCLMTSVCFAAMYWLTGSQQEKCAVRDMYGKIKRRFVNTSK